MTRTTNIATLTGLLDLSEPDPAQVTLKDIALKLATKPRWGGVLQPPLSVALHSLLVADQLPPAMRIYGLLHDAHEAYIGDITTPLETELTRVLPGFGAHLANLKNRLDIAIRTALGVPEPSMETRATVHSADMRMAATEWLSLMPDACGPSPIPAEPYRQMRVKPLAWPDADSRFRQAVELELAMRSWEVLP
ncbi:MAG TPA: hypothetical protein VGN60_00915 [Devosia sp.]|jgi:hypothetical protein|nr:hypothetical protein [Devosia sp.]